jgi:hypothetical protein
MAQDRHQYQWRTAMIHAVLGLVAFALAVGVVLYEHASLAWLGLMLAGITNVAIAHEKWDLYRREQS